MRTVTDRRRLVRLWALGVCLLMVTAACSGSKRASDLAGSPRPTPAEDVEDVTIDLPEATGTIPEAAEPGARRARGRATTTGGSRAPVAAPGEQATVTSDPEGRPVANLFKPEEDRVGITDSEITVCMHWASVLGDIFNNKPEDEIVYWQKLNDEGGIYGRKVRLVQKDDAYNPDRAREAAESCKQDKAFVILSGVGFDQIPAVRSWAEQNRQLYFYSMATESGAENLQFSFATAPTLQTMGRQIAQYFLKTHPGKSYAALSRNSPNWDGALDAFTEELARHGKELSYVAKVNNGDDYNSHINQLRGKCPSGECALFANENVLNFVKMVQQSEIQGYRPQWFNYGFQLTNDQLQETASKSPAIEAWYPTPAYDLYNETNQPWFAEIQAMQRAYQKYRPSKADELNDVDWQFWLAFKALHRFLLDCGQDCSRNRLVGMLLNGYKTTVDPLCQADFSRGNRHFGAHQANIYRAVPHSEYGAVWKQTATCRESF